MMRRHSNLLLCISAATSSTSPSSPSSAQQKATPAATNKPSLQLECEVMLKIAKRDLSLVGIYGGQWDPQHLNNGNHWLKSLHIFLHEKSPRADKSRAHYTDDLTPERRAELDVELHAAKQKYVDLLFEFENP
eukprot:PhM_4_TR17344/c0_g1_i1/m.41807